MTIVWVVHLSDYDGSYVGGVFSTQELAESHVDSLTSFERSRAEVKKAIVDEVLS